MRHAAAKAPAGAGWLATLLVLIPLLMQGQQVEADGRGSMDHHKPKAKEKQAHMQMAHMMPSMLNGGCSRA